MYNHNVSIITVVTKCVNNGGRGFVSQIYFVVKYPDLISIVNTHRNDGFMHQKHILQPSFAGPSGTAYRESPSNVIDNLTALAIISEAKYNSSMCMTSEQQTQKGPHKIISSQLT